MVARTPVTRSVGTSKVILGAAFGLKVLDGKTTHTLPVLIVRVPTTPFCCLRIFHFVSRTHHACENSNSLFHSACAVNNDGKLDVVVSCDESRLP